MSIPALAAEKLAARDVTAKSLERRSAFTLACMAALIIIAFDRMASIGARRMTPRPRTRRLPKPDRRRALELLASCPEGCTEAIMLAHGFTPERMVEMIRDELATTSVDRIVAGGRSIEIARVKITDAGRRAVPRIRPR